MRAEPWGLVRTDLYDTLVEEQTQQAPDDYVTSGWRWTWRRTDDAFWLKI